MPEATIQDLADRLAIQRTISLYAEGCSRRAWDQVVATFLPDGKWEVVSAGLVVAGHDALRAVLPKMLDGVEMFVQLNSPAIIDLAGDTAAARSMIRECARYAGSAEGFEAFGTYEDELVRSGSEWKFARRRFVGLGVLGVATAAPRMPG